MKRFVHWLSIPVLAGLAGCAGIPGTQSTVADVEAAQGLQFAVQGKPWDAAGCIDKNVKQSLAPMFVSRTAENGRGMKLTVTSDIGTAGIVDIQPAATGSRVVVKLSAYYVFKGRVAGKMVAGC